MRYEFYDSIDYRKKQSERNKIAWQNGRFSHNLTPMIRRKCQEKKCEKYFEVKRYDPKIFCSRNCSAHHNNLLRGNMSPEIRRKISRALKGKESKYKGKIIVPRLEKSCLTCKKVFVTTVHQNHKYCSVACSIHDIGGRVTSPKAARGKSGIREDISSSIYFYSRWEANFARILNRLHVKWEFQYKTFDLESQNYTPDFFLPYSKTYVEIKNFLSEYSRNRDEKFRQLYPQEKLVLILKPEYLKLQEYFAPLILEWEFS